MQPETILLKETHYKSLRENHYQIKWLNVLLKTIEKTKHLHGKVKRVELLINAIHLFDDSDNHIASLGISYAFADNFDY